MKNQNAAHPVDEMLPFGKLFTYGLQHVLAMYAGAVAVPLILANALGLSQEQLIYLINADLLTCGIATIIQDCWFWQHGNSYSYYSRRYFCCCDANDYY